MSDPGIHQLANENLSILVLDGLYLGMINAHLEENTIWARDGKKESVASRKGQTFKINESEKAEPDQDPRTPTNLSSRTVKDYIDNGMDPENQDHGYFELHMNKYSAMTNVSVDDAALAFDDTMEPKMDFIAEKAAYTRDLQARRTLLQAYENGLTYVTVLSASPVTTLTVKNTNGFTTRWVAGVPTAVSGSNTIEVYITNTTLGTVTRQVSGCTPGTRDDNSDMIPGTITLSASVAEIAVGDKVISKYATPQILPNGKSTSYNLASGDKLTFLLTTRITSWMMHSGIQPHRNTGYYHFTGDTEHFNHFWEDSVFQNVFQGRYDSDEVRNGKPAVIQNILFQFTQRPARNTNEAGVVVKRALVTGEGALCLGVYEKDPKQTYSYETESHYRTYDAENNIHHIVRKPIDALGDYFTISYKAYWGFAARTDSLFVGGSHPYSPRKRGVLILSA
ncbi:MAG: hypothetical protein ACAI44_39790 [Candidatus Sericytochromatia bacterium]